jgi:hypothetical protein
MTSSDQTIEISLNKSKIVMMFLGALLFVGIGFWFVIDPPKIENSFWGDPTKLAIIGYASILFFGLCAYFFSRKLPDNKPGLIIDNTGLIDNSGGFSAGSILWSDIQEISVLQIQKQKMIMIYLKNPQDYIERQTSFLKRKGMQMNFRSYGTPVSISPTSLKTSFDELYQAITNKFHEKKSNTEIDVINRKG